eukprot:1748670-Pleurochrysis_carterae.AAC.1
MTRLIVLARRQLQLVLWRLLLILGRMPRLRLEPMVLACTMGKSTVGHSARGRLGWNRGIACTVRHRALPYAAHSIPSTKNGGLCMARW